MPTPEQLEEKLEATLKAIELRPSDAKKYSEAGLLLDRQGKPREAIAFARFAVNLAPKRAAHYDELGLVLRHAALSVEGHLHRHRGDGGTLPPPQRVPGGDDPCWRRAEPTCFPLQFYGRDQLHIAESDFLRRVEADDSDSHGFELLATLYRNLSTEACTSALKIEPTRATAYLTLARLLPRGGTVGLYTQAIRLLPSQAVLYREFGALLTDLRYFSQANSAYRTAIALEPSNFAGYESLAELRLMRGRPEEAISIARQTLDLPCDSGDGDDDDDDEDRTSSRGRKGGNGKGNDKGDSNDVTGDISSVGVDDGAGDDDDGAVGGVGGDGDWLVARATRTARGLVERSSSSGGASARAGAIAAAIALMAEGRGDQSRLPEAASLARAAISINNASARGPATLIVEC